MISQFHALATFPSEPRSWFTLKRINEIQSKHGRYEGGKIYCSLEGINHNSEFSFHWDWQLVTNILGQPTGPIFKGHVVHEIRIGLLDPWRWRQQVVQNSDN
jgi:hypothetical protein